MVDQKRQIRLLEDEKEDLLRHKSLEADCPSMPDIFKQTNRDSNEAVNGVLPPMSKRFVSMPQLDKVSLKTSPERKPLIRRRGSLIGQNGLRNAESCQALTRDDLRTMTRAMSWLQVGYSPGNIDESRDEERPDNAKRHSTSSQEYQSMSQASA